MDGVTTVRRYLDAMVQGEWDTLAACLTPDVERLGPYGDDYHGTDGYVAFLRATIGGARGLRDARRSRRGRRRRDGRRRIE